MCNSSHMIHAVRPGVKGNLRVMTRPAQRSAAAMPDELHTALWSYLRRCMTIAAVTWQVRGSGRGDRKAPEEWRPPSTRGHQTVRSSTTTLT